MSTAMNTLAELAWSQFWQISAVALARRARDAAILSAAATPGVFTVDARHLEKHGPATVE